MNPCEHCGEREAMRDLTVCFECRHHGEHRLRHLRKLGVLPGGYSSTLLWVLTAICLGLALVITYLGQGG